MIVVMGATGHTGSVVADRLLAAKQPIRVLGRSADRLQAFTKRGAIPAVGDATDPAFLTDAFRGASAAFVLIPPDLKQPDPVGYYDRVGAAVVTALKQAQVPRAVLLSSLGAELPDGTGLIAGLYRVERRLEALGISLVVLRPAYFFENFYSSLGVIKQQGINGSGVAPDVPIAMIATQDIGAVAAEELPKPAARGNTARELLGPRDYTMTEATRIIGQKIGKPDLKYVQFPDAGMKQALLGMGFSPGVAEKFVEMSQAISTRKVRSLEGRNARTTTPTTLETFADRLAEAYRGM